MLDVIRHLYGNMALSSSDDVLAFFTSEIAIIIYVFVILAIIAVLVVAVIFSSRKDKTEAEASNIEQDIPKTADIVNEEIVTERFCMLSAIDRKRNGYGHSSYKQNVTLEEFCDNFRNYAAYRHGLYYDIEDIRRFVAGMSVSRMLILQGTDSLGSIGSLGATLLDSDGSAYNIGPTGVLESDVLDTAYDLAHIDTFFKANLLGFLTGVDTVLSKNRKDLVDTTGIRFKKRHNLVLCLGVLYSWRGSMYLAASAKRP